MSHFLKPLAGMLALVSVPGMALTADPCTDRVEAALVLKAAEGAGYVLAVPSEPEIQVGRQFGLVLTLCGHPGVAAVSAVDATMPKHRHGMNYRARVSPGHMPGTWKAQGLLMHMPGEWRLTVDVGTAAGETPMRYTTGIMVAP